MIAKLYHFENLKLTGDPSIDLKTIAKGLAQLEDWISKIAVSDATVQTYIPLSQKGVANGVAILDSTGKVPTAEIP
jgi:hypothetical protein